MCVEYKIKRKKLYDRGNEALSYRIEIPRIEGAEEINSFYFAIAEECEKYCNEVLFGVACNARREDRGIRCCYSFTARVTHLSDGLASVLIFVCFRRGGEAISRYTHAHTWDMRDACLIPPRYIYKRMGKNKLQKSEFDGAFLLDGEITNLKNVNVEEILSKRGTESGTDW